MAELRSPLLDSIPGVRHAFGGPADRPPSNLVGCRQVHGNGLVDVGAEPLEDLHLREADALITNGSRPLGIQTADCLPVLFALSSGSRVGAAHAGWKGLLKGILIRQVEVFREQVEAFREVEAFQEVEAFREGGAHSDELRAAIGPAIRGCCLEVSPDAISQFENRWGYLWRRAEPPWWKGQRPGANPVRQARPRESSHWLDLAAIARLQLESLGVASASIELVGECTYCGSAGLASFRRATHEGGKTGARQWSWIQKTG